MLREGLRQAQAAGPARISLTVDSSGTRAALRAAWPESRLVALLARIFTRVPAQVELHGVIDLAERRAQLAGRHVSVLQDDAQTWSGRPGRLLSTLEPERASARNAPLEVFDRLATAEDVTTSAIGDPRPDPTDAPGDTRADGVGAVDEGLERHLIVTTAGTAEQPATRVRVWFDEAGRIRKIRYPVGRDTSTVIVHGSATDSDLTRWDRLPILT